MHERTYATDVRAPDPGGVIGRQAELGAIDRFLDLVPTHPCGLILEGDAGIGKTRLWKEGVERGRARGYRVLITRPGRADVQLGFAGLADLLREMDEGTWGRLPAPQRRALGTALLLRETSTKPLDDRAVMAASLTALRMLAEAGPLILAVDDLQWLDAASAQVLEFALRRLEGDPIGTLATVRTEERPSRSSDLVRTIGEGHAERITLGPLSLGATHELLVSRLDLHPSRPTLVRLHDACGGNPFYALQLGEALRRFGREPTAGEVLPVPRELGVLVGERLAGLSGRTRSTLLVAAALTQPTLTLLGRVSGERTVDDIDEAVRAGIVEVTGGDIVRFTHPLLASIHYGAASVSERRAVHLRLAEAMGTKEERARHLALASPGPDAAVAAELDDAARSAAARGASLIAAQLLEQAATLTPPDDRTAVHRRRLEAAAAYFEAGGTILARELLEAALADAAAGNQRAEVLYQLGTTTRAVDGALSFRLLEEAAGEAGADDALRAKIFCALSHWVYAHHAGFDALERAARTAVELAERSGDTGTLAVALGQLGGAQFLRDAEVPTELMEQAMRLEEASGDVRVDEDAGPTIRYAEMLFLVGEFVAGRELLERLCERAHAAGQAGVAHPLHLLAYLEFNAGRWDRAEGLARKALDVAAQSGRESEEVGARTALGLVLAGKGDLDSAREQLMRGLRAAERSGRGGRAPRSGLAMLEMLSGDPEAAWGWIEPAVALIIPLGVVVLRPEVAVAIEALVDAGRLEAAERLLTTFEDVANKHDRRWAIAAAARSRALALAAEHGRLGEAETHAERAVALGETLPFPVELARALLVLGTVQRRLHRKQRARATLQRALSAFEALPAPIWAARARQELSRVGGRPSYTHELSATEERIAELVANGRSNREIANSLHLSVKTVEWNLSKIFRKFGVRSRTELAAALSARR